MDWRKYEKDIFRYFEESYPDATVLFDQRIEGRFSKTNRQIDILIKGEIAGYSIFIVVDCKFFSKKIDVKHVESFSAMVEDVGAHQGVLITGKGYSRAATNRAYYGVNKIELDIINFDDLQEFQSLAAIPYSNHFSVFVPAPFGWVLDLKDKVNSFASIHQRGISLKTARKRWEWMYMELWTKENSSTNIETLIEIQNNNLKHVYPEIKFEYNTSVKRNDQRDVKIRIAYPLNLPALEVTGFIEFNDYIFYVVLFTPEELLEKNLKKLQHILKSSKDAEITFDNKVIIQNELQTLDETTNLEERANKLYQIGIWHEEMDNIEVAYKYHLEAIDNFPHYGSLKKTVSLALRLKLEKEASKHSEHFFNVDPVNPTIPQDLADIYFAIGKEEFLKKILMKLITKSSSIEAKGNLSFHLSLFNINTGHLDLAKYYLDEADQLFSKVLKKDHQVFEGLNELRSILNESKNIKP